MSSYTIMLRKIDSCSCKKAVRKLAKTAGKDSWKRQLEKTAVVKAGAYIVSIDKKKPYTNWKLVKLSFLQTRALAVHSNAFLYFTDLPVSSSL